MSGLIKKTIKISFLCIVFYAIWIFIIPFVIKENIPCILNFISDKYNISVNIDEPVVRLDVKPYLNFSCKKFNLSDKDNSERLDIDNINFEMRIIPIITGNFHFNSFNADNVLSEITVSSNSPLINLISENNKSKTQSKIDNLHIKKYNFTIKDNISKSHTKIIGTDLIYKQKYSEKIIKTTGKIVTNGTESDLFSDIHIVPNYSAKKSKVYMTIGSINLNLLSKIPAIFEYFSDLRGFIDLSVIDSKIFVNLKDFSLKDKKGKLLNIPENLVLRSEYDLIGNDLILNNMQFLAKNIHIRIDGIIKQYLKKHKYTDISLKIIDTKSVLLTDILPELEVPDFSIERLKFYGLNGIINADLKIKGRIDNPKVSGNIHITDCGFPERIIKNSPKADIKINLKDKKLYSDTVVPVGNTTVKVDGISNINGSRVYDFKIKANDYIDFNLFHKIIVPLHEIFDFEIGVLPCISGDGLINFDLKTHKVKDKLTAYGTANFKNIKTNIDQLKALNISCKNGNILMKDSNVDLNLEGVKINEVPAKVDGVTTIDSHYDITVVANDLKTYDLFMSIKEVLIPENVKDIFDNTKIQGNTDIDVNLKGQLLKDENIVLDKNVFLDGKTHVKNNSISLRNYGIKNLNADINYDKNCINVKSDLKFNNSTIFANAEIKQDIINTFVKSEKINLKYLLPEKYAQNVKDVYASLSANYKGNINLFDINKLDADLSFYPYISSNNLLKIKSAKINLKKGILKLYGVNASYKDKPLKTQFVIRNLGEENCITDGIFKAENIDISVIDTLNMKKYIKLLNDYAFEKGFFDIDGVIKDNKPDLKLNVKDILLEYKPLDMPVQIVNGKINIYNDKLLINKFNCIFDSMPLLANGTIYNYKIKPMYEFYINAVPKQNFVDKYVNKYVLYPIKLKGDILTYIRLKGLENHFNLKSNIKFSENSSLYYMGATLGDPNHKIEVNSNIDIIDLSKLKIKDLNFSKFIYSQDNKLNELPLIKLNGEIALKDKDVDFNNFRIKTVNPTDAKIFNIIFKKPNIKQGQFTSDLKINGRSSNPKILGVFSLNGIDIPFFNTTIRNVSCDFKDSVINLKSDGEALNNKYILSAQIQNKLTAPYKINNSELFLENLNLDEVVASLKHIDIEQTQNKQNMFLNNGESLRLSEMLLIDKLRIVANKLKIRTINAENLEALISLNKNKKLSVDKFSVNTAQGRIDGDFSHNLNDKKTNLYLNVYSVKANTLSETLFDLHDQIYGDLTGTTKLSCVGDSYKNCLETLSGKGEFIVNEGRMPKLGSLEYLLKAGNLIKSGITGLSINGIIDLISPVKTGEFNNINGLFVINQGIAETVKVFSNGKDLNLYITGNYNFKNSVANMMVFGRLSKNVSTIWGNIGNLSLNTLLNTIPHTNINSDEFKKYELSKVSQFSAADKNSRKFVVEILGDINGKNYVQSFRWLN